MGSGGNFT